jgi:uncharacterized repeat protein (TIGR04076 family)
MKDTFSLHNLTVEVVGDPKTFVCSHRPGEAFKVVGENLVFDKNNQFSLYALAALLPLLPAKQRSLQANDWMLSDELIACPDPNCGARFKISRSGKEIFNRDEVTKVSRG